MTYRPTKDFYKKSNIDYLNKITNIDTAKQKSYVKKKNIDTVRDEIDIHIPIKYFNPNIYNNLSGEFIYIVSTRDSMYLCHINEKNSDKLNLNTLYRRKNTNIDFKKYSDGLSLEMLMPEWIEHKNNIEINICDIIYISVLKKLTKQDIFNCFRTIDFSKDEYNFLYHNTGLEETKLLDKPTFFYFVPFGSSEIYKMTTRKCITLKITHDINDIIDLTSSIVTNNSFTKYLIDRDRQNKKWKSYDNLENTNEIFHENNRCITSEDIKIDEFIKQRPYCDINESIYYSGRRKLQEILFKTRKYDLSKIYYYHFMKELYKKYDAKINPIYHPKDINPKETRDYEKYILQKLDINGFFFTDFADAFNKGGEIMLLHPYKFLEVYKTSDKPCR